MALAGAKTQRAMPGNVDTVNCARSEKGEPLDFPTRTATRAGYHATEPT